MNGWINFRIEFHALPRFSNSSTFFSHPRKLFPRIHSGYDLEELGKKLNACPA